MIELSMKIGHPMEELSIPIARLKPQSSRFLSPKYLLHQSNFCPIIFCNFPLLNLIASKAIQFFFRIQRIDNAQYIIFLSLNVPSIIYVPFIDFSLISFSLHATTKLAKPFTQASSHHSLITSLNPSNSSHIFSNLEGALPLSNLIVSRQTGKWSYRILGSLF